MGWASREYKLWREERGINPWADIIPREDKHDRIRREEKGKKKRMKMVDEYGYFDKNDVATMLAYAVDYYSNTGLVIRNKDTGEYNKDVYLFKMEYKKE